MPRRGRRQALARWLLDDELAGGGLGGTGGRRGRARGRGIARGVVVGHGEKDIGPLRAGATARLRHSRDVGGRAESDQLWEQALDLGRGLAEDEASVETESRRCAGRSLMRACPEVGALG